MARPDWFINLIKKVFPGRFLLAELTRAHLVRGIVDHSLFWEDDTICLPRDTTIQINQSIPMQEEVVLPSQVVEHFIAQAKYLWIMNSCLCREAKGCEDYSANLGCLFLGEAVLGINPAHGRLASKDEALEHTRACQEAGLVHMVGRNKVDTFWLGVNPGYKLLTICNCCPCCCAWTMLPHLDQSIRRKTTRMPGVSVKVNDLCIGCGDCAEEELCFSHAIQMNGERAIISEECRGCGRCVEVCPWEAIELSIDDPAFVERSIRRLFASVDVS